MGRSLEFYLSHVLTLGLHRILLLVQISGTCLLFATQETLFRLTVQQMGEKWNIEYAITALGIEQVVVCGHSHCGAMKGLLKLNKLQADMPLVYDWLKHAEATRRLVKENYKDYSEEELVETLVAENVLIQIENLKPIQLLELSFIKVDYKFMLGSIRSKQERF